MTRTTKIKLGLQAVNRAIKCLNTQHNFQKILNIIYFFGLKLSGGHWWLSSAKGFRLSSLNMLQSMKGTCSTLGSISLMDYIVDILQTNCPECLDFDVGDLSDVNVTSAYSIDLFQQEIRKLMLKLQKIKNLVKGCPDDPVLTKQFKTNGQLDIIDAELPQLSLQLEHLQKSFETVVRTYGEDVQHITVCEFFGYFTALMASMNSSKFLQENQKKLANTQWKCFNPLEQLKWGPSNPFIVDEFFQRLQVHTAASREKQKELTESQRDKKDLKPIKDKEKDKKAKAKS